MKLLLPEPFSIEYGDTTLKGEYIDLTPKQLKEVEKLSPKKELKQAAKLNKKILRLTDRIETAKHLSKWDDVEQYTDDLDIVEAQRDAINDTLETYDAENIYKKRLELCISGDDKKDIIALSEVATYSQILGTIQKDIQERTEKN